MFGAALGLVLCSFGPLVAEGSIVFLPEFLPLKYESGFSFTTVNGTCTEVRWVDGEHPACKVADGLEDWPADCATTFSAVSCSVDPQGDSGCVESELTDSGKTWVRVTFQPSSSTVIIRLPWFKLGTQWFRGVRMMHFKPSSPKMTLHASTALTYAEYRDILTSNIHSDYHDSIVQVGPKEIGDSSWTNKSFSFVLLAGSLDVNSELVASELSILIEKCRTVSACGEISGRIVSMSLEGDLLEENIELPNLPTEPVEPTFPEDTSGSGNDASTAVIIGATLGAAVVVGLVIIGIALYRTRRQSSITPLPTEAPPKAAGDESSHFTKTKPNIDVTPTVSGTALPEDDVVDLHKHLTLAHEIGRGAFGKVYLALHTTTGKMYAVKETACPADNQSVIDEIRQEVEIIRPLHHPNLVRYFDLYFNDENGTVGLVLEYMTSGSLQSIIEKFGKISEPLAKTFTRQALLGLNYLHEHQVLHRDIKPGNMLLDHLGTVKVVAPPLSFNLSVSLKATKARWFGFTVISLPTLGLFGRLRHRRQLPLPSVSLAHLPSWHPSRSW